MAPIENAAGYRLPNSYNSSEQTLQKIAQSQERGQIQPFPKGEALIQLFPKESETLIPFCSYGGIIIPNDRYYYNGNPLVALGPYVTYSLEKEDGVWERLGCQEIALTGGRKVFCSMMIEGREVKLFLGKTKFSEGNRIELGKDNYGFRYEATLSIAALALTPRDLLDQALKGGILIGVVTALNEQMATVLAHAAVIPAKRLDEVEENLFKGDFLLPIPLKEGPIRLFESVQRLPDQIKLNQLKTLLDPTNPKGLKPVVICWKNLEKY